MSEGPKKSTIILASILGIVVALGLWVFSIRNNFVTMEESLNASWSQVENQMQRRYDLIPNLVNTVKGYAKHESGIFEAIAEARARMGGAKTPGEKIAASQGMESALSRLMVVVENYPNLKADQQFSRLMDELAGTENRLSVERRKYNESVQLFNTTLRRVPQNMVASLFHFQKKDYFKVEEKAKENPQVQF